jgi:hypothetical protein
VLHVATDREHAHAGGPDEALARLEDVLLAYSFERALPDLTTILRDAGVSEELLRTDERATKLLHEAIVARPLATVDAVSRRRIEVELLTLEVEVLTERIASGDVDEQTRAAARLADIRAQLAAIRDEL